MKRIFGVIAAIAALSVISACGTDDGGGGNTVSMGSATFSGAVTGSITGMPIAIVSDSGTGTPVSFNFSGSGSGITFSALVELNAGTYSISTGTYTSANTELATGSIVQGQTSYGLAGGNGAGTSPVGSYTLTITSAGSTFTGQGVTTYLGVHGTLTAAYDLNETAGGTATNVSVTF